MGNRAGGGGRDTPTIYTLLPHSALFLIGLSDRLFSCRQGVNEVDTGPSVEQNGVVEAPVHAQAAEHGVRSQYNALLPLCTSGPGRSAGHRDGDTYAEHHHP